MEEFSSQKGKKAKADANVLTIEKCINFTPVDLKKMGPKEIEAVGAMLNTSFTNLFITDNKVKIGRASCRERV